MITCHHCSTPFEVTERDRHFLSKFEAPEPTLCPPCRDRRRQVWRCELHLFTRKCDKSGKPMLSHFPADSDFTVYSPEEWHGDGWDPLAYGRDFDFSRPFFEQFGELIREVPQLALASVGCENSDYCNCCSYLKNCYLIAGANYNEDCHYSTYINRSKDCVDCSFIEQCELCYECNDCKRCYNLRYSDNCSGCIDSTLLDSCKNCRNCFGCVNLVNKEYHFFNEPLSKEDYERKVAEIDLATVRQKFEEFRLLFPKRHMIGEMNENATGSSVFNSRNTEHCFDVNNLEDCRHCTWLNQGKDCMDVYSWGLSAEQCYECCEVGANSVNVKYCVTSFTGSDLLYCFNTFSSSHCFGSTALKHKKFCIFNKQYSEEDYHALKARIIEHMKNTGEWGEFFPMSIAPFAYNHTIAQDYYRLSKEEALALGARWADESHPAPTPDALICANSGRPFRLTAQEKAFYQRQNIPTPTLCFQERNKARIARRLPRQLHARACSKCAAPIKTPYAPERPERVYCQSCYLAEVY